MSRWASKQTVRGSRKRDVISDMDQELFEDYDFEAYLDIDDIDEHIGTSHIIPWW